MKASTQFIRFDSNAISYQKAIELYGRLRKKTYVEVVNQFAKEANLICSKNQAQGGVKRVNITKDKYLRNATDPSKYTKLKSGKYSKSNEPRRIWFALAAKQGAKKGKPFKRIKVGPSDPGTTKVGTTIKNISDNEKHLTKVAATIRNRRRSRSGSMAAGFFESAKKLGYKLKGNAKVRAWTSGSAIKSIGRKATKEALKAFSVNRVTGSFEVGNKVMAKAIDKAVRKELKFAYSKLDENSLEVIRRQSKGGRK